MPNRGTLALPRTNKGLVLIVAALLIASAVFSAMAAIAPQRALAITGAIYTSNIDGSIVNANHYDSKPDVYLTGGPCQGGSHLDQGDYYFEVSNPDTGVLLSTDNVTNRKFSVGANGFISGTTGTHSTNAVACQGVTGVTLQLIPYNDTTNPGGVYKLTVSTASTVEACDGFGEAGFQISECKDADKKSDNFKVLGNGDLKIVKKVDGGEASGTFTFHVDCGAAFEDDVTVTFPSPGFVVIPDITEGSECTVTETGMPNPPANFEWGQPTIDGSPATIAKDQTVTVTATNHLIRQKGSLEIKKVVTGGTATGDFTFHVDCGQDFSDDVTITLPGSGSVTIDDIPAGAVCTVTETGVPTPPSGFKWNDETIDGSPATIEADETATVTVTNPLEELPPPGTPALTIDKSNNAPLVNGLPTAKPGDTVIYTLAYDITNPPVHHGIITDVLPAGVTYVTGSAKDSANGEFVFDGYDSGTRTLTWLADGADGVTEDGSVTYQVTINSNAASLPQPLVNTATIDSEETQPDQDTSRVFVPAPPQAETSVPHTAPPTDTSLGSNDADASGTSMLLILLALAGIALAVFFVAPTPASIRKRR